ncbi:site-specific integrase [Alkalibacillus sp. S2W]|uniref:site-specific integrase n=1 Tax=Alkalibacillus sp. S2W TaxID=3386553 RepID=UPI00398CF3E1
MSRVEIFKNYLIKYDNLKTFNSNQIDYYKNLFESLITKGAIIDCDFDDSVWKFRDGRFWRNIEFGFELNPKINTLLKSYTVYLTEEELLPSTIKQKIDIISDSIFETEFYKRENVDKLLDYIILQVPKSKRHYYYTYNKEFFDFFMPEYGEIYINTIEGNTKPYSSKTKPLPPFEDILEFDNRLMSFYNSSNSNFLKEKFLPILLWWKLTMIIPMRPEEFVSLKRKNFKKVNGKYKLKVERRRPPKQYQIKPTTTFYMPTSIGELIDSYIELSNSRYSKNIPLKQKDYIIPSYMRTHYLSERGQWSSRERVKEDNYYMGPTVFYNLLQDFYSDVVGEDLIPLTTIDTRHLAISNMRMQGYNPLTIARLAGHASLETQNHYANHLETFLDSKMKLLSQQLLENEFRSTNFYTEKEVENLQVVQQIKENSALSIKNTDNMREIEGGYCQDESFPNNCISNCLLCPFFQIDFNKKDEIQALLKDTTHSLNKMYQEQLNSYNLAIEQSVKHFKYHKDLDKPELSNNEEIKSITQSINKSIYDIARLNALNYQIEERKSKNG